MRSQSAHHAAEAVAREGTDPGTAAILAQWSGIAAYREGLDLWHDPFPPFSTFSRRFVEGWKSMDREQERRQRAETRRLGGSS